VPALSRRLAAAAFLGLVAGCAGAPPPAPAAPAMAPAQVVADLAPQGKLRAAINYGNPVLAARHPSSGEPSGVSVDLARELARRLGVPLEFVTFDAAGKVVAALKDRSWDVAFLAIDPVRGREILYSPPYVLIEGSYLVPQASPIRRNEEVDREGNRVVVGAGSAYDLFLSRELKRAALVRTSVSGGATATMISQGYEVTAGVRQQLEADARRVAGVRLLEGRFMVIEQAMGTPAGREAGARYLRDETDAPPLLCMLVANHTCALIEASERGLQGALAEEFPIGLPPEPDLVAAITYCDLSVGPSGRSTTADERITEILTRYGDHDLVHKAINYAAPALREQYARVDSARAGVGTYGQAP